MDNEPIWQDEAMKDAREVGQFLKEQYNMQPAVDEEGFIIPPPTVYTIDVLSVTGKQSITY